MTFRNHSKSDYPFTNDLFDWVVFGFTLLVGAVFAWRMYATGFILRMVDQYSHLSIARQIFDSMTPGVSQLGTWPALLHLLIAPFASIDFLYQSGLAGAFALVPILAVSAVLLYRLLLLFTDNRWISLTGVIFFAIQPYVLYFSVTPMTEMLFIAFLIGSTYFLAHWWQTQSLQSMVLLGVMVALAGLARFEGFILVPSIGMVILLRLLLLRVNREKIEAALILFGLIATLGIVFTFVYNWVFAGDALSFLYGDWSSSAQQKDFFLPVEGNILLSLYYLWEAVRFMIHPEIVTASVIATFLLLAIIKERLYFIMIAGVLLSPLIFDAFALVKGSAVLYMPHLPPYPEKYFNVRYGLFVVGFVYFVITLAVAELLRPYFLSQKNKLIGIFITAVLMGTFGFGTLVHFNSVTCQKCFDLIRSTNQPSPKEHTDIAKFLRNEYSGGKIILSRVFHNEVVVRAEIPLKNYILESNEGYFDQAVEDPWWYAEWVVMFNREAPIHGKWFLSNERVSLANENSEMFKYYYEPVFAGKEEFVYKLRRDRVLELAIENGINPEKVPSLNHSMVQWNVNELSKLTKSAEPSQLENLSSARP